MHVMQMKRFISLRGVFKGFYSLKRWLPSQMQVYIVQVFM